MKHLPGNKYSSLELKTKLPNQKALFSCICGREKIIDIREVARHKVKSCGCLKHSQEAKLKRKKSFIATRKLYPERFVTCKRTKHILSGFNRLIRICRQRGETNLTPEYLESLYINQNKKCILSHLPIYIFEDSSCWNNIDPWNLASVDRIDNNKPYEIGNIHLTSITINYARNISSIEEMKAYLRILRDGYLNVNSPNQYSISDFFLLWRTLHNTIRKECRISKDDLYEIWISQKGQCAYSKTPMILKTLKEERLRIKHSYNFQCSVDRINSDLPYIKNNIQLVSVTSNFGKNNLSHDKFLQFIKELKMVDLAGHSI